MDSKTIYLGIVSVCIVAIPTIILGSLIVISNSKKSHTLHEVKKTSNRNLPILSKSEKNDNYQKSNLRITEVKDAIVNGLMIVLFVSFLFFGLYCIVRYFMYCYGCPNCKYLFYKKLLEKRILFVEEKMGLVTRKANIRAFTYIPGYGHHKGKYLPTFGQSTWEERAPILHQRFEEQYFCIHCKYKWIEINDYQSESFSK